MPRRAHPLPRLRRKLDAGPAAGRGAHLLQRQLSPGKDDAHGRPLYTFEGTCGAPAASGAFAPLRILH